MNTKLAHPSRDAQGWSSRILPNSLEHAETLNDSMQATDAAMTINETPGHDALWGWFGLSYASFLVLPRCLMHAMPDEWQAKMAKLLEEYEETFDTEECGVDGIYVSAKRGNKFCKLPDWTSRQFYRHPDQAVIDSMRRTRP